MYFTVYGKTYMICEDPIYGACMQNKPYVPYECACQCAKHVVRSPKAHRIDCCLQCSHCNLYIAIELMEKHMLHAHPKPQKRVA